MNVSVYIFGKPNGVYSQVPLDHTRALFEDFASKRCEKTPNMMMMHRDRNSVYYAGILQLDTQNYIGACLLMSGVIIYDVETMFRLFQWTFEELANRGILLHYNSNKRIEALEHIDGLAEHPKDTQHAEEVILNMFSDIDEICRNIPPTDYTRSNTEFTTTYIEDKENCIDAIKSYSTVYFTSRNSSIVRKYDKLNIFIKLSACKNLCLRIVNAFSKNNKCSLNEVAPFYTPIVYGLIVFPIFLIAILYNILAGIIVAVGYIIIIIYDI